MKPDLERVHGSRGLSALRTLTRVFDELVRVPGTNLKFGLDPLLGLLPGGGDLLGGAVSAYAIVVAGRLGAPASVIMRMGLNILIDTVVGSVPLLGDLFDVGWKANRKNLDLLERYVANPRTARRSSLLIVALVLLIVTAVIVGTAVLTVLLIAKLLTMKTV